MIKPHYYQLEAKNAFFNYFNEGGTGNPLICMPTGTGKSVVLADILRDVFRHYPNQRVMVLTHVWKLIQQNAEKLQVMWPTAPVGIHSAGLNKRDCHMPIIFGGIQSVAPTLEKNPLAFGWQDLIFIDEAHLLSGNDDSQYQQVIKILKTINPDLKVVGLTATPYRLKMGKLTEGGIFTDIAIDLTSHEWFKRLISEGYLCPLIGKPTNTKIEGLSSLGIVGGEYNQKQAEEIIDTDENTYNACREILEFGHDRNKCMVFAQGVDNAEHIAAMFQSLGVTATCVHSKLTKEQNKQRLEAYSNGKYWAMVGANMLTTGYDEPSIDIIADMQPTLSPGKHVQKLGRGTRVHKGKNNTLVLDFVNNIAHNGPIDDPVLPRKPGSKSGDPPPVKICPQPHCGAYNHASVRFCCNCGFEFLYQSKLEASASYASPMKTTEPVYETLSLMAPVFYSKHQGREKVPGIVPPPMAKVVYAVTAAKPIVVHLCFEHTGFARRKAHEWWHTHSPNAVPQTVDEFLSRTGELRIPRSLVVQTNLKYPEVKQYEF
jgi:DNA repair protein RadD